MREVLAANLAALMARTPALDTQLKLARRSGIAQSTIGRILRQEVSPTVDVLEAIAHAFEVPVVEIVKICDMEAAPLDSRLTELRQFDLDMIDAFIEFTVARRRHSNNQEEGVSVEEIAPSAGSQAAIQRAINRPMSHGTLNLDEERTASEVAGQRSSRSKPNTGQGGS